jgi:hypothetical protein
VIEYRTKTGSVYEVDGKKIRRVVRSAISASERVSDEWREAESIACDGVGTPLVIVWGLGRDEHSAKAIQVGEGDVPLRTTVTSPVVEIIA